MPNSAPKTAWPSALWPITPAAFVHHKVSQPFTVEHHAAQQKAAPTLSRAQEPALLLQRANAFCKIGLPARALADLEQAQQMQPGDILFLRASAAIKINLGQLSAAMSDLNQAARLQPASLQVACERSVVHLHRGCFQVRPPQTFEAARMTPWPRHSFCIADTHHSKTCCDVSSVAHASCLLSQKDMILGFNRVDTLVSAEREHFCRDSHASSGTHSLTSGEQPLYQEAAERVQQVARLSANTCNFTTPYWHSIGVSYSSRSASCLP